MSPPRERVLGSPTSRGTPLPCIATGGEPPSVALDQTDAEPPFVLAWDAGASRHRPGVNRFGRNYPVGIYQTRQDLIGVTIVTPGQWRGICTMFGMPELARDPKYAVNVDRLAHAHEIDALFQPVWETRTATE